MEFKFDSNTIFWYHKIMNRKHQRTLEAIFKQPVQSNVVWKDIESLMRHLMQKSQKVKDRGCALP